MTQGYHNLTHHGKAPDKITELTLIEVEQIKAFRDFLAKLHSAIDCCHTLDQTGAVKLDLGNASAIAGGGFKHANTAFSQNRTPMANRRRMLQRLGVESPVAPRPNDGLK